MDERPIEENDTEILATEYFHTGNSGTLYEVGIFKGHPALNVTSTTYGHLTHKSILYVDPLHLARLGDKITDAAEKMIGLDLENHCTVATDPSGETEREHGRTKHAEPPKSTWRRILSAIRGTRE